MRLTWLAAFVCISASCTCGVPPNPDGGAGGIGGGLVGGGSGGGAGGGSGGSGGGTSSIPLSSFCDQRAATECAMAIRCGFVDPSGCGRFQALFGSGNCLAGVTASLDAGLQRYDGALARQCVDAASTLACTSRWASLIDACRNTLQGTVALGGACYDQNDCAPGGWCDSSASVCPGVCRPTVDAGTVGPCPPGTFSTGGSECVVPVAQGGDCRSLVSGFGIKPCAAGLFCDTGPDAGATCQPFGTPGTSCGGGVLGDTVCGPYQRCLARDGGMVCVAFSTLGGPCNALNPSVPTAFCRLGLGCSDYADGGVCVAAHDDGGSCQQAGDCVAPLFCLRSTGTCLPQVGLDAGCQEEGQCQPPLTCANQHCTPPRTRGEACSGFFPCATPLGCVTDGGVATCQPVTCLVP